MTFKYETDWSICKSNTELSVIIQDAVGVDLKSALKYAVKQAKNILGILSNEFIEISLYEYKIIVGNDVYLYKFLFCRVVGVITNDRQGITQRTSQIKQNFKGSERELAKLFLNNLYGKMATNTNYTRNFTIRAGQKNFFGLNKKGFVCADTDSIYCVYPFYKRWLKKNILKIICSLIIAFVICLMLGFSRPYSAFGGEDLIPLGTLFAWGLAYLDSWEKEKNSHK